MGGHDFQLLRQIPPAYGDNVQRLSNPNGPNPLEVSRQVMAGASGTQSVMNRTVTLVHYGQHVAEVRFIYSSLIKKAGFNFYYRVVVLLTDLSIENLRREKKVKNR